MIGDVLPIAADAPPEQPEPAEHERKARGGAVHGPVRDVEHPRHITRRRHEMRHGFGDCALSQARDDGQLFAFDERTRGVERRLVSREM